MYNKSYKYLFTIDHDQRYFKNDLRQNCTQYSFCRFISLNIKERHTHFQVYTFVNKPLYLTDTKNWFQVANMPRWCEFWHKNWACPLRARIDAKSDNITFPYSYNFLLVIALIFRLLWKWAVSLTMHQKCMPVLEQVKYKSGAYKNISKLVLLPGNIHASRTVLTATCVLLKLITEM